MSERLSNTRPISFQSQYLFVYGTLKSTATCARGLSERRRLHRESRWLGPARTAGRLYDLDGYPGLALKSRPYDVIFGELVELTAPTTTFGWLDRHEGVRSPGQPAQRQNTRPGERLYIRKLANVALDNEASTQRAWVYVLLVRPRNARWIADGRWLATKVGKKNANE